MKQRRRRISILLSMLLLLSVFQPAVALDVDPDFEQIYEIGTRLLGDIEHEKELYGLGGVDFDNLYIGEYIPAYIAKETGLVLSDVRNYPVLENGEWVATLTCSKSDGIWNAQLSNTFVPELPEISVNDNLKLIFDSNTCYLSKNSAIHNLTSYNAVAERVNIASSPMTISATDGQKLVNKRAVEIGKFDDNIQSRSSLPTQIFLNVPLVSQQPHSYACWAACVKAIGSYFGTNYTIDQIYGFTNVEPYEPTDIGTALTVLSGNYGLYTSFSHNVTMPFEELKFALYDDYLIFASNTTGLLGDEMGGHAVVIRGYVSYTNSTTHLGSVSYMNPWNGSYTACSVNNSNQYEYINSSGSRSGFLTQFGIVGEY